MTETFEQREQRLFREFMARPLITVRQRGEALWVEGQCAKDVAHALNCPCPDAVESFNLSGRQFSAFIQRMTDEGYRVTITQA